MQRPQAEDRAKDTKQLVVSRMLDRPKFSIAPPAMVSGVLGQRGLVASIWPLSRKRAVCTALTRRPS
jgi:hypothetical protein